MEPNLNRFSEQGAQHPCFVHPRPATGDGSLKLLRLRLVMPDLEAAYDNLVRIFAPASRSNPYQVRRGGSSRTFRIGLGGLELEYRQPLSAASALSRELEQFGPGVIGVDFAAREPEVVAERARVRSFDVTTAEDDGEAVAVPPPARWRIASRSLTGFDVGLERFQASPLT